MYVEVAYYSNPDTQPMVCVCGGGATGMEYIAADAQYIFHRLLEENDITYDLCRSLGLQAC